MPPGERVQTRLQRRDSIQAAEDEQDRTCRSLAGKEG